VVEVVNEEQLVHGKNRKRSFSKSSNGTVERQQSLKEKVKTTKKWIPHAFHLSKNHSADLPKDASAATAARDTKKSSQQDHVLPLIIDTAEAFTDKVTAEKPTLPPKVPMEQRMTSFAVVGDGEKVLEEEHTQNAEAEAETHTDSEVILQTSENREAVNPVVGAEDGDRESREKSDDETDEAVGLQVSKEQSMERQTTSTFRDELLQARSSMLSSSLRGGSVAFSKMVAEEYDNVVQSSVDETVPNDIEFVRTVSIPVENETEEDQFDVAEEFPIDTHAIENSNENRPSELQSEILQARGSLKVSGRLSELLPMSEQKAMERKRLLDSVVPVNVSRTVSESPQEIDEVKRGESFEGVVEDADSANEPTQLQSDILVAQKSLKQSGRLRELIAKEQVQLGSLIAEAGEEVNFAIATLSASGSGCDRDAEQGAFDHDEEEVADMVLHLDQDQNANVGYVSEAGVSENTIEDINAVVVESSDTESPLESRDTTHDNAVVKEPEYENREFSMMSTEGLGMEVEEFPGKGAEQAQISSEPQLGEHSISKLSLVESEDYSEISGFKPVDDHLFQNALLFKTLEALAEKERQEQIARTQFLHRSKSSKKTENPMQIGASITTEVW